MRSTPYFQLYSDEALYPSVTVCPKFAINSPWVTFWHEHEPSRLTVNWNQINPQERRRNIFATEIVTPMDMLLFRLLHKFTFPNGTWVTKDVHAPLCLSPHKHWAHFQYTEFRLGTFTRRSPNDRVKFTFKKIARHPHYPPESPSPFAKTL